MKNEMTQSEFWNLPFIKERQDIQKQNPYGSDAHRKADEEMKAKCVELMGQEFAEEYWGNY